MAIKDVNPQAPVHFLVLPKKTLSQLSQAQDCDEQVGITKKMILDQGTRNALPNLSR